MQIFFTYLGTWTIFAWELGRFLLGNLDDFYLGTWTVFTWELGRFSLGNLDNYFSHYLLVHYKKRDAMHCVSTDGYKHIN